MDIGPQQAPIIIEPVVDPVDPLREPAPPVPLPDLPAAPAPAEEPVPA